MNFANPKLHEETLWSWLRVAANILSGYGFPDRPPLAELGEPKVWMPPNGPDDGSGGWRLVPACKVAHPNRTLLKGWASVIAEALDVEYHTVLGWARGRSFTRQGKPRQGHETRLPSVATLHALLGLVMVDDIKPLVDWRPYAQRRGWNMAVMARMFHVSEATLYRWVDDPPPHFVYAVATLAAGYPIPEAFHAWTR